MSLSSPPVLAVCVRQSLQAQLADWLRPWDCHFLPPGKPDRLVAALREAQSDLVILEESPGHPELDYALCCRLQEHERTAFIPIVIVAAGDGEYFTRQRSFVAGIVEVLKQPLTGADITRSVSKALETRHSWEQLTEDNLLCGKIEICKASFRKPEPPLGGHLPKISAQAFADFKEILAKHQTQPENTRGFSGIPCWQLYETASATGIPSWRVAHQIAEFTGIPYLDGIMPHQLVFGPMPSWFCFQHAVAPFINQMGKPALALANPFECELIELLRKLGHLTEETVCYVTEPENIRKFAPAKPAVICREGEQQCLSSDELEGRPTPALAEYLLESAVARRATDIHIEPKASGSVVRLRIDGDLHDIIFFEKAKTAQQLISRFKILGEMDIAETRQPQDGGLATRVRNKNFALRLSTTCTPDGECLKIRILEPEASVKELMTLGMNKEQCRKVDAIATRTSGMLLLVGPAGAGKTTTAYSLLTHVPWQTKNIISAENPIEYKIPFVSQHQVHEKAGISYEILLKASVRQDPDILFIGEIRDPVSAQIAVEFASTGRLTLTTLHAINATAALFRLECFGLSRGVLAENICAIIAQRLLKCLCPVCKTIRPLRANEQQIFACLGAAVPSDGGYPVGCAHCNFTGYYGRTGVFEILTVDQKLVEMIRRNVPQSEIRQELRRDGIQLLSEHALDKVKNYLCSPQEVITGVFQEELEALPACPSRSIPFPRPEKS
ncbi:MAG: Flp pilus assembly complex ATPase component TadA [Desulfobulbaceae bacterium]|nr:Flp pilus assembly complex ATPase component TadA [Desulfobulbaceae bacterium]